MIAFLIKNKYFFLLLLLLIVSEIVVNPIGNFPLNDDWSYGKSELFLLKTGKITIGDFPAMTLWTHLVWGLGFTKLFGFSFTVLRFSTLISAAIGLFFLNRLIVTITNNAITAFVVCLVILFNPLYFSLANTYMTDVNFNTLLVLCLYFSFDFFKTRGLVSFVLVFIMSTLLVLLRQFGIIVPICFTACCFFIKEKRWAYMAGAMVLTIGVFIAFKFYENYLKDNLEWGAAYKFSSGVNITQRVFWDNFFINLKARYVTILLHILVYAFPLALLIVKDLFMEVKATTRITVSSVGCAIVLVLFRNEKFPMGNCFSNMFLGAETFYQTLHFEYTNWYEHCYSPAFNIVAIVIKNVFGSVTMICLLLIALRLIRQRHNPLRNRPELIFLAGLFFSYIFLLLVPDSYMDRYHLPLILLSLVLFSFVIRRYKSKYVLATLSVLLFFYTAVFGTKDYLLLNRKKWEAYDYLKNTMKVDRKKINGGFEINCWNEGEKAIWYDFTFLERYDYLIQYRIEKDFHELREYEFQRYFPYKKDKIYIFVREAGRDLKDSVNAVH